MHQDFAGLQIVPEFQRLIPPLRREEYKRLERNILRDGCREPLSIWNRIILDGHKRYEICTRHGIPFSVRTIMLSSHDAAIAWICANQIGRRNISDATRKYLIGKRYEAEKRIWTPNCREINQPSKKRGSHTTATELGQAYRISHFTVQKYARFAIALDAIAQKEQDFKGMVLLEQIKTSQEHIIRISRLPDEALQRACNELTEKSGGSKPLLSKASIKDMPAYDPDSEVSSLALTIPSWRGTIERISSIRSIGKASAKARNRLYEELKQLVRTSEKLLSMMREGVQR